MFKNNLSEIFPFVHNLYDISELILVGSDVPSWLNIVSGYDLEKVHYINQSDKNYNFESLPLNWQVSSKLLAKEDGDTTFYSLSNPMLNGTVSSDILVNLWQNLKTLKTIQKEAVSLKTFIEKECSTSGSKMVVVDSFDGLFLLNELDSLQIDVIALRVIADDDEIFANVSEAEVKQKLQECGYKNIATYDDNHPKIKTAVYVKDLKQQTKEYENNLNAVNEELTAFKNKTKTLEENLQQLTNAKDASQKELSEIKTQLENKTKELANANQTKEQELAQLKSELETKNKALQEKQANSEQLQKQKIELEKKTKEYENNLNAVNEELTTFKNKTKTFEENLQQLTNAKDASQKELSEIKTQLENKTKELANANQTKEQELAKLKNELETKNKVLQEKTDIIKSLIISKDTQLTSEYLETLDMQEKVKAIVSHAMCQEDVLESIDFYVLGNELGQEEKFEVCCEFAQQIAKSGDRMQGVGFINNAKLFLAQDEKLQEQQYKKLINLATSLNQFNIAVDFEMEYNAKYGIFQDNVNKKLFEEYKKIRNASHKKQQHGQDLLIDYINENIKDGEGKSKVMVEVGTTRENVPGQGSTLQLATLCKRKGIKFITVDMDAHNTRWANFLSKKYDLNIEAITRKGEDFLKYNIDEFDFVFLDAYDFDHGMHSELRQSRYEKYLGSKIDEKKAHKMHLKCAKSVVKKLKKDGVVCVDDTRQDEDGEWSAKGTLAVPYLIDKKFNIIDNRNRAVLLKGRNE